MPRSFLAGNQKSKKLRNLLHHHYTKLRNMIYRSTLPVIVFLPFLASWNIFFTTNVAAQILGTTEGGQLASFTTPQFTDGDSHRQDVCERYFALNNGTVRLEDVLRGMKLNVVFGAYDGSYFNYNNETGVQQYGGIVSVIMDELSARAGFTWRDSFGIYDVPSGKENETWTDLLEWSVENYDLTIDWWAKSLDRMNLGVAFLKEWYDSSIILISKNNLAEETGGYKTEVNLGNWMEPFTWGVWFATIGTIVLSGVVYQLIEWMSNDRRDRKFWVWFSDSLYLSAMNSTQAYEYGTPRTAAAKLFGFSSALWGLILTATYTANLASLLVTSGSVNPVSTVQSIEDVTYLKYPVCTWAGTILDSHLEANHASTIRKPQKELVDIYNSLNRNECLFAVDTVQGWLEHKTKSEYNPLCKLKWVGDDRRIATIGAGFVAKADSGFKCTSLIRDVIDFYMEQLVSEGFVDRAWETENKRNQDLDCDTFRPELVTDLEGFDEDQCGRRHLQRIREKRMLEEVLQSTDIESHHRRMKVATKSAASAAGALDGEETDGEQMELGAMIGAFFVHWVMMAVSLVVAATQRYRKQKQPEQSAPTAKMFEKDSSVEENGNRHADLQQQIKSLNEALAYSNFSHAKLLDQQMELRHKIEDLTTILENFVNGRSQSLHDL